MDRRVEEHSWWLWTRLWQLKDFLSHGVGSGLTDLRCRQPETTPCTLLNCPEPGALTCVVYFLCSSEGPEGRQGVEAISSPIQSKA